MVNDEMVEKAKKAFYKKHADCEKDDPSFYAALEAVEPMVLEKAAKVADAYRFDVTAQQIAAAIRALGRR